jgi:hypothetical protein
MHIRHYLGLISIAIFSAMPTYAQNLFQVEVIVFANENPASETEETWPQNTNLSYPDNAITLLPETSANSTAPEIYTKLPTQKLLLNEWRDRLRGSRQYRVLAHTSWLQPASGERAGKPVVITGGTQYGEHFELEGNVQIRGSGSPLKLAANLWMSSFVPTIGESETTSIVLPVIPQQLTIEAGSQTSKTGTSQSLYTVKRIITQKAQENASLNKAVYLDHPILGVLIKVTEFKIETTAVSPKINAES